jgi:hypothetical protein
MTKKSTSFFLLISLFSLAAVSCSNPKSSVEYKALEAEIETLNSQILSLSESIEQQKTDEALNDTLYTESTQLIEQLASILSDPARRQSIVSKLGISACKARSDKIERALPRIDRMEQNSAWYTETDRGLRVGNMILGATGYATPKWPQALADYSAALNDTRCLSKALTDFYSKYCETVDKMLINKNPEAFKGKCIKGTVRIVQADSNTGPCAFQGYVGGGYDVRAQFGQSNDPVTHYEVKDCYTGTSLVENDFITFYAYGLGAYTYTTSNGGSQTVPAFKLVNYQKG